MYESCTKVSLEECVDLHQFQLYLVVVVDELGQFAIVRSLNVCRIETLHLLRHEGEFFRVVLHYRYVEQAESVDAGVD